MDVNEHAYAFACIACFCCLGIAVIVLESSGGHAVPEITACFEAKSLFMPGNGSGIEGTGTSITCAGEQVIALGDGKALVFRLNQTSLTYDLVQTFDRAIAATQTCDGSFVAIARTDGTVSVYVATPSLFVLYNQPIRWSASMLAFSCTNAVLAGAKGTLAAVYRFNGTAFHETTKIRTKTAIHALAMSCVGDTLALTQPASNYVALHATDQNGTLIASVTETKIASFASSVALAGPAGMWLAVGAPNASRIFLYNCQAGGCQPLDSIHEPLQPGFGWSVAVSGNGGRVLAGTWSNYAFPGNVTLYAWNEQRRMYAYMTGLNDAELGKVVSIGHSGREYMASAGGTTTRRIAQVGCWQRIGAACPVCL